MAQWGDRLEFLKDIEADGTTPQALETKPVIHFWMIEYITAFELLNKTRTAGMAANPISLCEILAYLQLYGASDTEAFIRYIVEMDASFLAAIEAKKPGSKSDGTESSS